MLRVGCPGRAAVADQHRIPDASSSMNRLLLAGLLLATPAVAVEAPPSLTYSRTISSAVAIPATAAAKPLRPAATMSSVSVHSVPASALTLRAR